MKFRYLGRSGLLVSRICLGTMTFGNKEWGCDQESSSAIVRKFIEAGGNFIDTANSYSNGEFGEDPRRRPRGLCARRSRDRDQGLDATDLGGDIARHLAKAHRRVVREEPQAPRHGLHRPLPVPRARSADADRGVDARDGRPRARGKGPLRRLLQLLRLADRAGERTGRAPRLVAAGLGAASLQPPPPRHRTRGAARMRRRGRRHDLLEPACGRHAQRQVPRAGQARPEVAHRHPGGDHPAPLLVRRRAAR